MLLRLPFADYEPGRVLDRPRRPLEFRRHEGAEALRALSQPLLASGLLPAPVTEMEPQFLAERFEGDGAGAVVASRGSRPVAFVPYVLRRARFSLQLGSIPLGSLPFRQLVIFGYASVEEDHAALLDGLVHPLLSMRSWDVAQLFEWPLDSPLSDYFTREGNAGFPGCLVTVESYDTLQVRLEPTFETYLKTRFTKKTRYNLKREVRLIEEAVPEGVSTRIFHSPDDVEDFYRDAEPIARKTYQRRLGLNSLRATASAKLRTANLAARGRWRSYILYLRGEPAAYCYGTVRWGELSYDVVGYDPRYVKLNPGKVLLFRILEDLHEWQRVAALNFGKGITGYKELFATSSRRGMDALLYRSHPYPRSLRLLRRGFDSSYRWLNPRVQHWMPAVKRLFGRGSSRTGRDPGEG
jgi:hypothetical protein